MSVNKIQAEPNFIKHGSTKSCLAKKGYQLKYHAFTITVGSMPLISCLEKEFAQQNVLLNSYIKIWPMSVMIDETHVSKLQSISDTSQVTLGAPALCNQALVRDVHVAHVQHMVDGLQLTHLDEPDPQSDCCRCQDTLPVVNRLDQNLEGGVKSGSFVSKG